MSATETNAAGGNAGAANATPENAATQNATTQNAATKSATTKSASEAPAAKREADIDFDAAHQQPDLSIRARPPSPRRLSRKVLLGGAILLAAIVSAALIYGLSASPDVRVRQVDAQANVGGPPESIAAAPGEYARDDLSFASDDADGLPSDAQEEADLNPPTDPAWSRGNAGAPNASASQPAVQASSPQDTAFAATPLFERQARPSTNDVDAAFLSSALTPPRSRYEVMAGSVIAASLLTELNSDAAGRVIAQVTAPVFDSVTGRYLLIPQGSRLIGAYGNEVAYGDRRLILVWRRLIFPNGWSIDLQEMEGTDPSGAAGLRDRTDNHLDRLVGAVALSAIISVVANNAEDGDEDNFSLAQNLGDAAAQEAARSGGRIVERELNVRPTLRIRAGAPVRVLVTRDMALRPYRGADHGGG